MAEQIGALLELQREGKIRHIGLSEVSIDELRYAQALGPIASVQNRYNLASREHQDVLDYAASESIAFMPWFPLATGTLAAPGSLLADVASRRGVTPAQLALAWLLHISPVMLPIRGSSDPNGAWRRHCVKKARRGWSTAGW